MESCSRVWPTPARQVPSGSLAGCSPVLPFTTEPCSWSTTEQFFIPPSTLGTELLRGSSVSCGESFSQSSRPSPAPPNPCYLAALHRPLSCHSPLKGGGIKPTGSLAERVTEASLARLCWALGGGGPPPHTPTPGLPLLREAALAPGSPSAGSLLLPTCSREAERSAALKPQHAKGCSRTP